MKKLSRLLVAGLIVAVSASAQDTDTLKSDLKKEKQEKKMAKKANTQNRKALRKLEGPDVSYQAKQSFEVDFPHATAVSWQRDGAYDKVTFMQNSQSMAAYYDFDAKLVGTVTDKQYSDLPVAAQKYIEKKYADYTKGKVIYYDDNEFNETDMILYGTQFEDEDNYFIELSRKGKTIVLQVTPEGEVFFFADVK